mgnify:CR=1 FL=1
MIWVNLADKKINSMRRKIYRKISLTGLLLITMLVFAGSYNRILSTHSYTGHASPQNDYEEEWKKADSLIAAGLPRSAMDVVESIYSRAKDEGNSSQFIRSVIYKIRLRADYTEDFAKVTIADLKDEIRSASSPDRQFLHSLLAEIYWRYYTANRYKFLERTAIAPSVAEEDIASWDVKTLVDRVIANYMESVANAGLLKQTDLKKYDPVLITAPNSKKYRPTLYDFLAHRAVDFFMNEEPSVVHPAEGFEIDDPQYFAPTEDFVSLEIATQDSLSLKYYAMLLLQDLASFHLDDTKSAALIDVELKRLKLALNESILQEKDSLYLQGLRDLKQRHFDSPESAEISYKMAMHLSKLGDLYNPPEFVSHRWDIKRAVEKCNEAIRRFPDSDGADKCTVLISRLTEPELQLTLQEESPPDQPQPALVQFRNITELNFKIIRINFEINRLLNESYRKKSELTNQYNSYEPLHKWFIEIPAQNDYQPHSMEIKIPELDLGYYIILSSPDPGFNPDSSLVAFAPFRISNISYVSRKDDHGAYQVHVLDRESGEAIPEALSRIYYRNYDYSTRKYEYIGGEVFTSDENGYFEIPPAGGASNYRSFHLEIVSDQDTLTTDDHFYRTTYQEPTQKAEIKSYFFTDRKIYRPGQIVYFKGIVLEKSGEEFSIKKDYNTRIGFLDANNRKLSDIDLTTNEFGSFHGSFTIPSGILTGRMTLKNETGYASISVEEYKRPTFEVAFDPLSGSYKPGEEVEVGGSAETYSGAFVDDAEVRYRVVREVRFPFYFRGWFDRLPGKERTEIANGITRTDGEGNFSFVFRAIPEPSVPGAYRPVFHYRIYADVTDISGETQSAETSVNVGHQALFVGTGIPSTTDKDNLREIIIKTTNLNGVNEPAAGTVRIFQLREPERIYRDRKWKQPDVFVMDEKEFHRTFDHDMYKNEGKTEQLAKEKTVLEKEFNTAVDSVIMPAEPGSWETGRYLVELETEDIFGEKVVAREYFTLYSGEAGRIPVSEPLWTHLLQGEGAPGDVSEILVGTALKELHLIFEVTHSNDVVRKEWILLEKEQRKLLLPITENLRGGFTVRLIAVKHNRSYEINYRIDVPYNNKKIGFALETFRDQLKPGEKEQWEIKLTGPEGESVAAEMAATMYDISLDAFVTHDWSFTLYRPQYGNISWQTGEAFSTSMGSVSRPVPEKLPQIREQDFDRLNWFGFNYYGGYTGRDISMMEAELTPTEQPGQPMSGKQAPLNGDTLSGAQQELPQTSEKDEAEVQVRRDFRETAFFYPELKTDENGAVIISFDVPESLTRWKFMGMAHTKDLKIGTIRREIVTQKQLMIMPNPPRFFRQGDKLEFTARVMNLTEEALSGTATLDLLDLGTMQAVNEAMSLEKREVSFTAESGGTALCTWHIEIPEGIEIVVYSVKAVTEEHTDGEQKAIPVLPNRMLVTESMPMPLRGNETRDFNFEKLLNAAPDNETTRTDHNLVLEFSSNPSWYAVQALPVLTEDENESINRMFERYYANSLAAYIVNTNPAIRRIFEAWRDHSPDALLSVLERSEELKSVLLEETPWVRDARNDRERKYRIALLFDLNSMSIQMASALTELRERQSSNGGWPWFPGMRESRHITQEIVAGFGHLQTLNAIAVGDDPEIRTMLLSAIQYMDHRITEDYNELKKREKFNPSDHYLTPLQIQYLYARSFFTNRREVPRQHSEAFEFFREQAKKYWLKSNKHLQGMIALALHRMGDRETPDRILASLREHAVSDEEMGMYWKDNSAGFNWHEAPVETQALLIEAFAEIGSDMDAVGEMKIWLLKQKQTQAWGSGKATADAVYALLIRGESWLEGTQPVVATAGDVTVDPQTDPDINTEAGTGYYKTSWQGDEIVPEKGKVTANNPNKGIAWGAMYWQYFEDLDKITAGTTELKMDKSLFLVENTASGPLLKPVEEVTLSPGDEVAVRITVTVDRDLEYVHLKDMRAATFEPKDVLSGYRYRDGLGYYQSTKDASTHFYFDRIPKGTWVLEYRMVATQSGQFSNGISTIQSLYAPEFSSHSAGSEVVVE